MIYKKKCIRVMVFILMWAVLFTGCTVSVTDVIGSKGESTDNINDTGNSSQEILLPSKDPTPSATISHRDIYKAVLLNEMEFYNTDEHKNMHLDNVSVSSDTNVITKITHFAVVDLDGDGYSEVILWVKVNGVVDYGSLILHYQDEKVYGYNLVIRAFMDLKTDGTFSFSSGAANHGFSTISFSNDICTFDRVTYCESGVDSDGNQFVKYIVNHESAGEANFYAAYEEQDKKADVLWYELTEKNIEAVLSCIED